MLQKLLDAIDAANGVSKDMWSHISSILGRSHPSLSGVFSAGERYYLSNPQKKAIRDILPFMAGASIDRIGSALMLPPHEPEPDLNCEKCGRIANRITDKAFMAYVCRYADCDYKDIKIRYTIEKALRCGRCKGPFHPATGHHFDADTVACGICFGRFVAWQMKKYGWRPLTKRQRNKLELKKKKQKKAEEREAREEAIRAAARAKEAAEKYGQLRYAQAGDMMIVNRAQSMPVESF